jgi:copper chaperone CopZ
MRQFVVAAGLIVTIGTVQVAAQDGKKAEFTGAHICCGQCVKVAKGILEKVDGVSDVKVDQKSKTCTFTAKDSATATKAIKAMYDGGFAGKGTFDGTSINVATATSSNSKTKEITVKGVHACCGQCHKAIKALFEGAEVKIDGTGPQRDITITGTDLSPSVVLKKLNDKGFNGNITK